MKKLAIILAIIFTVNTGYSDIYSAGTLNNHCKVNDPLRWENGFCVGSIVSFFNATSHIKALFDNEELKFCPTVDLDKNIAISILDSYLKNNPDKKDFSSYYILAKSLSEAFPCKK